MNNRILSFASAMLAASCALFLLNGCACLGWWRTPAPPPPAAQSAVVLDFSVAPRVVERRDRCTRRLHFSTKPVQTEQDIRGWWFGAEDVYYNANVGLIAADLFSETLQECGLFRVFSRQDLRRYYIDKQEVLREELALGEKEAAEALLALNPVAIGRELGVDKVIVGHICDAELRHNRTSGHFATANSFTVSLYDVASGKLEFTNGYGGIKGRTTQYPAFAADARRFVSDLRTRQAAR